MYFFQILHNIITSLNSYLKNYKIIMLSERENNSKEI